MSVTPMVKRGRARFVLSLRGLMLLVLVVGGWMGWIVNRAETRREAVATLKDRGAIVLYDYESLAGAKKPTARTWAPAWLRKGLGDDYFHNVTYVILTPVVCHHASYLTDHDLAPLQVLDRLEELYITDIPVTDAGLVYLRGMRQLQRLHVDFTGVSGKGLDDLRAALPALGTATNRKPKLAPEG